MNSIIIAIEGADASGKTTQAKLLCENLNSNDDTGVFSHSAIYVKIPARGRTSDMIYKMLNDGSALQYPILFQTLHFMNKLLFQLFELPKLKKRYKYIILDRWSLSSIVYGISTGVNDVVNRFFQKILIKPSLIVVLNGKSYERSNNDTYDSNVELQNKIRENYVIEAKKEHSCVLIDNSRLEHEVNNMIMSVVRLVKVSKHIWSEE